MWDVAGQGSDTVTACFNVCSLLFYVLWVFCLPVCLGTIYILVCRGQSRNWSCRWLGASLGLWEANPGDRKEQPMFSGIRPGLQSLGDLLGLGYSRIYQAGLELSM